ncbi:MAG: hypothetical protein WAX77_04685 [Methylococcaceae bacterium]
MTNSLRNTIFLYGLLSLNLTPNVQADNTDLAYFKGGKADVYYDRQDNGNYQINSLLWTPAIKGGHGIIVSNTGAEDINYYGGFIRPLLTHPELGDLILGAQQIDQGNNSQTEFQGEYRLPMGLGFGGGFVEKTLNNKQQDIQFAKISYRNKWHNINYIFSTQWQNYFNQHYAGGYIALYNPQFMASWGQDGEQWRSTLAYVAPDKGEKNLRPAIEAFYVDNSIGQIIGSKDLMLSGSLGFRKGFLGHESRLGRAMGPSGVEFSNPLGYLNPNFNRRLTAWEIGDFVNFRFIYRNLPNGKREQTLETAVYPTQFLLDDSFFNALFAGFGQTDSNPSNNTLSALLGYHKRIGNIESSMRWQHDFNIEQNSFFIDFIYWL